MADQVELAAISEEEFCGPDLDLEGDLDFMNYFAAIEGQFPSQSFFDFDRKDVDFPTALATAAKLKARTHDLRLNLIVAKLHLLNRDFYAFAAEVSEMKWLLDVHWDDVHPRAEQGKFTTRLAQLSTLDDVPVVVMALQYATLLRSDREGPLNYRAVMVANGDAKLRENEKLPPAAAIDRLIDGVEVEVLEKLHGALSGLGDDLAAITALTTERIDHESAVTFVVLSPLVAKATEFARGALARRGRNVGPAPTMSVEGAEAAAPLPPSRFETLADIDAALASALGYFQAREPSSPALLLIVQARATLGKNLYEVIRLMTPRHAENARVFVGPADAFSIPVKNLADAPALDFTPGEAPAVEARGEALALIEQVAAHLRAAEPSSPAPYLLDRARSLATRDFLSLLDEMFSADDLQSMRNRN